MTNTNLNTELLSELEACRESGVLSQKLKEIYMNLVWKESQKDKWKFVTENDKSRCEAYAYEKVCTHGIYFNPSVSDNAIAYMGQIIGSAFAYIIGLCSGNYRKKRVEV